ncbi:MAG TPA: DoxX family protein [Mucilaginibacter sp.]|nr:DoxX family protein [Mucilaginibacter sp.]
MKTTKILYWICTILIVGLMVFSAISSFMPPTPDGAKIAAQLQYPPYLYKFLAVAKLLGAVAILIPGFARLKEWAYAGYFFDIFGAAVSFIIVGQPIVRTIPMFVFIAILFGSYFLYHKLQKAKQA